MSSSNRDTVQNNLRNNLQEITDLLGTMISAAENFLNDMMWTSNIPRQHRQMIVSLEHMQDQLGRIDLLLNAYTAMVVHRVPPQPQLRSRKIRQAFRVFQDADIWQQYPGIVRRERQRLTSLSSRLDNLKLQVRQVIFYLRSLSSSRSR